MQETELMTKSKMGLAPQNGSRLPTDMSKDKISSFYKSKPGYVIQIKKLIGNDVGSIDMNAVLMQMDIPSSIGTDGEKRQDIDWDNISSLLTNISNSWQEFDSIFQTYLSVLSELKCTPDQIRRNASQNEKVKDLKSNLNSGISSLEVIIHDLGAKLENKGIDLNDRSNSFSDDYNGMKKSMDMLKTNSIIFDFDSRSERTISTVADLLQLNKNSTSESSQDFADLVKRMKSIKPGADGTYSVSFKSQDYEKGFTIAKFGESKPDYIISVETKSNDGKRAYSLYFADDVGIMLKLNYSSKHEMELERKRRVDAYKSFEKRGGSKDASPSFTDFVRYSFDNPSITQGDIRFCSSKQFTVSDGITTEDVNLIALRIVSSGKSKRATYIKNGRYDKSQVVFEDVHTVETKVRKAGFYRDGAYLRQ